MGYHPLNLTIRFILELSVLISSGTMMYKTQSGSLKYIGMIALPLLLATIWGVFAVEGDKSRSGNTVVPTKGILRLVIELAFFGFGGWALSRGGFHHYVLPYSLIVVGHYIISYDRIKWLLNN